MTDKEIDLIEKFTEYMHKRLKEAYKSYRTLSKNEVIAFVINSKWKFIRKKED